MRSLIFLASWGLNNIDMGSRCGAIRSRNRLAYPGFAGRSRRGRGFLAYGPLVTKDRGGFYKSLEMIQIPEGFHAEHGFAFACSIGINLPLPT